MAVKEALKLEVLHGKDTKPYLEDLARLRMEVFRDFPYLYEGDKEAEEEYLSIFADSKDSILILAFDGNEVVGASTAQPLDQEMEVLQQPWIDAGYDPSGIFYHGESVLKKEYRGQGIGVRFFEERERKGYEIGNFDIFTFCRVLRPEDHPLRPSGYVPLDEFWKKRGYYPTENIIGYDIWQDIDQDKPTYKPLHYWYKEVGNSK